MKIDSDEIIRALKTFYSPGDVFEVRCLEAVTIKGTNSYQSRPHIESGYFDFNNIAKVPQALGHIQSARGIYVTPNPVNPDLLARCAYRIQPAMADSTTKDKHILKRQWLLIDCDVEHNGVSGISSSESEHEKAIEVAYNIRDNLFSQCQWPEPVVIDTGNGASLMYLVGLDVSDGSNAMVAAIIDAFQFYNTNEVKIDPQVKNLSRVWRLPGTMNCKGDDIPERPHRMARIISRPECGIEFVGKEQLMQIADWQYQKMRSKSSSTPSFDVTSGFNLEQWIRQYCPDVGEPVQSGDQRKWYFKECPFSSGHSSPQGAKDTYIGQYNSGAFFFKCSHSHCANYRFDDLRDLREPGWRERKVQEDTGVNLSGIVNNIQEARQRIDDIIDEIPEEEVLSDTGGDSLPFPEELYDVPGIVREVMDTTLKYAPEPNRPLALGGALALMATVASRKVITDTDATPNIYLLLVENSGDGKNFPRKVNKTILMSLGMDKYIGDKIASGAGLEDILKDSKTLLWQNDEFQYLLADMGEMRKEDNNNSLSQYLLTYYTEANSIVKTRSLAGRPGELITYPHLIVLGTTQPPEFFDSMSERVLRNGLFARINILLGEGLKKPDLDREISFLKIDDSLLRKIKKWCDFQPAGSGNLDIKPMIVQYTADAKDFNNNLRMRQYEKRKSLENDVNDWKGTLWTRFREMANKYALIYSCSSAPEPDKTIVTLEAMKWGAAFVEWDIENRIKMIEHRYFRSEYEKQCTKVIEIMRKWHEKMAKEHPDNPNIGMPSGTFNVKCKRFNQIQLKDIVAGLIAQKRLVEIPNIGKGGGSKFYLPQVLMESSKTMDGKAKHQDDVKKGEEHQNDAQNSDMTK